MNSIDSFFSQKLVFLLLLFILLPVGNHFALASENQSILLECTAKVEHRAYPLQGDPISTVSSETSRIVINILDDDSISIGSRKDCRLASVELICDTDEQNFTDIQKGKHRRKMANKIILNRSTGKFQRFLTITNLFSDDGIGWSKDYASWIETGYCKKISGEKLF